MRCGSTSIDGSSLVRLECRICGNSIAWDGLSFGLATVRPSKLANDVVVSDAAEAFALREKTPPWVEASEVSGANGASWNEETAIPVPNQRFFNFERS